jgi:hypothetical protein
LVLFAWFVTEFTSSNQHVSTSLEWLSLFDNQYDVLMTAKQSNAGSSVTDIPLATQDTSPSSLVDNS